MSSSAKVDFMVRVGNGRSVAGTKGRRPSTFSAPWKHMKTRKHMKTHENARKNTWNSWVEKCQPRSSRVRRSWRSSVQDFVAERRAGAVFDVIHSWGRVPNISWKTHEKPKTHFGRSVGGAEFPDGTIKNLKQLLLASRPGRMKGDPILFADSYSANLVTGLKPNVNFSQTRGINCSKQQKVAR